MSSPSVGIDATLAREMIARGTGKGVRIAIIDSGVEISHPDLAGLILADDLAIDDNGTRVDFVPGGGIDVFGHGTAIASIIRSVAPEAVLGSIRVLGSDLGSRSQVIRAGVRKAIELGYQVLNCSFGCGMESQLAMYKRWIDEAYLGGVHIIAACNNFDVARPEWPGYFPSVVSVNFAVEDDPLALYRRQRRLVELAARGNDIEVAWLGGTRKRETGSSYAVPHVAGILARLLSECPTLSPLEAKATLLAVARPWSLAVGGSNITDE